MSYTAIAVNILFMLVLAIALKWTFLIFVGAIVAGLALFNARRYGLIR